MDMVRFMTFQNRLGQALEDRGLITQQQLNEAFEIAEREGKRLIDVLQENKVISKEFLATTLSFQLKVPIVNLKQIAIDPKAVELVPEVFAREHEVLPFALGHGGELMLAMESPNDFELINTLSAMTRRSIRPSLPLDTNVKDMLDVFYDPTLRIAQNLDHAARVSGGLPVVLNVLTLELEIKVEKREGYYAASTKPFAITVYGDSIEEAEKSARQAVELLLSEHSKTPNGLNDYLTRLEIEYKILQTTEQPKPNTIVYESKQTIQVSANV